MKSKCKQLEPQDIRLLTISLLLIGYPLCILAIFPLVVFWLAPLIALSSSLVHIYWLVMLAVWFILLAVVLPLMSDVDDNEIVRKHYLQKNPDAKSVTTSLINVETANQNRMSVISYKSLDDIDGKDKKVQEMKEDSTYSSQNEVSGNKDDKSVEIVDKYILLNETDDEVEKLNKDGDEIENLTKDEKLQKPNSPKIVDKVVILGEIDDVEKLNKDKLEELDKADNIENEVEKMNEEIIGIQQTNKMQSTDDGYPKVIEPFENDEQNHAAIIDVEDGLLKNLEEDDQVTQRRSVCRVNSSRASGYYECNVPVPLSPDKANSNVVFLYINPETKNDVQEPIQE